MSTIQQDGGAGQKGKCIPATLFTFGIYLLFICLLKLESLLCNSGCSGTHRDPVASASSVLGLKPCVIMASPIGFLKGLLASSNRITPHLNAKWPQSQKRNGRKENKYDKCFLPCIILKLKDRKMFNSKYTMCTPMLCDCCFTGLCVTLVCTYTKYRNMFKT